MTRAHHFAIHPLNRTGEMNAHSNHHVLLVHASIERLLIAHGSRAHHNVMPIIVRVRRIGREGSTTDHRAIIRGDTTSNTATHLETHREGSMGTLLEAPTTTIIATLHVETIPIQTQIIDLDETATTGVFKTGIKGTGSIQAHETREVINVMNTVITATIPTIPLHASHDKIGTPIQAVEIPMGMITPLPIGAMTTVNTMNAPDRMIAMDNLATLNVHIQDATRNETSVLQNIGTATDAIYVNPLLESHAHNSRVITSHLTSSPITPITMSVRVVHHVQRIAHFGEVQTIVGNVRRNVSEMDDHTSGMSHLFQMDVS